MARATGNYNPDNYGNTFEKLPEGIHQMKIVDLQPEYDKFGNEVWVMIAQPINQTYKTEKGFMAWLPTDGVVEALFDAGGVDPRKANPNKDYYPGDFIGSLINVDVWHKPDRNDKSRTYANIKRLYPAFTKGNAGGSQQQRPQQNNQQQNQQQPSNQRGYQGSNNTFGDNGGFSNDAENDLPF